MIQEIRDMITAIRNWANGKFQKKGNYSLIENTGYSLGLNIDNDYIMTIELKNAGGEVLSAKSVDFPIESMVIGASYSGGVVTLSLQNGGEIDVDVSDLVRGLVSDSFTIAGIDMKDDISKEELVTALGAVDKAGDTMIGDLTIIKSANDVLVKAKRSDTGVQIRFGVGIDGITHGLWSDPHNKWMIYATVDGIYLNGSATTIRETLPISKGGTGKTTGPDAVVALVNSLPDGSVAPTDESTYLSSNIGSDGYCRRPMSFLWQYIKSKWENDYKSKSHLSRGNFTGNIDALFVPGTYWCRDGFAGSKPVGCDFAYLDIAASHGTGSCIQRFTPYIGEAQMATTYERLRINDVWTAWRAADTKYTNFVKSGAGAKAGLVPAPPTTVGASKYLREDGTWQTPPAPSYSGSLNIGLQESKSAVTFGGVTGVRMEFPSGHPQLHLIGPEGMYLNGGTGDIRAENNVIPNGNNSKSLGGSNLRWSNIYSATSVNVSSDKNLKKDITYLSDDDRYIRFFMLLQPKSYLFKDGSSGRTHIGFISQDVEDAMAECGLTSLEFAGFCKDQKMQTKTEIMEIIHPANGETGEEELVEVKEIRTEEPVFDGDGNPVYVYSLRYEEFIALNTMMIQKMYQKSTTQDERISDLEEIVRKIESVIL